MYLKDHYKTLELEPSASLPEIKKAYRKLAQQYHPDKNNDPYAEAFFAEIKEAYETLTDPNKREQYLQQRWYNKTTGNTNTQATVTPVNVLKQAIRFERYTAKLDIFRTDKDSLFEYMDELLSEKTIGKLLHFNDQPVNHQIIAILLKPVGLLPSTTATVLTAKLSRLAAGHAHSLSLIKSAMLKIRKKEKWETNKWIIVLLVLAALCLLMFLTGE